MSLEACLFVSLFHLRLYPARFVGKILQHKNDFLASKPHVKEVLFFHRMVCSFQELWTNYTTFEKHSDFPDSLTSCQVTTPNVLQTLLEMPVGDPWDDGEVWTIYRYVRGSKKLCLPDAYRPLLFGPWKMADESINSPLFRKETIIWCHWQVVAMTWSTVFLDMENKANGLFSLLLNVLLCFKCFNFEAMWFFLVFFSDENTRDSDENTRDSDENTRNLVFQDFDFRFSKVQWWEILDLQQPHSFPFRKSRLQGLS